MDKSYICPPIPTEDFIRLIDFLREEGSDRDPVEAIRTAIDYWIENASWKQEDLMPEIFEAPAPADRGYNWKNLFLPHGTQIRMRYKGEHSYARVDGDKIMYRDQAVSPSQFAYMVAGSSRNAWRDLWIKRPRSNEWKLADDLRRTAPRLEDY